MHIQSQTVKHCDFPSRIILQVSMLSTRYDWGISRRQLHQLKHLVGLLCLLCLLVMTLWCWKMLSLNLLGPSLIDSTQAAAFESSSCAKGSQGALCPMVFTEVIVAVEQLACVHALSQWTIQLL
jgi:hypothetical protein